MIEDYTDCHNIRSVIQYNKLLGSETAKCLLSINIIRKVTNTNYKFSIGEKVRIISQNPWDGKRFPGYIAGKTGIVEIVKGRISDPMDHPERPPVYLVRFETQKDGKNHGVLAEVFEDWMLKEAQNEVNGNFEARR